MAELVPLTYHAQALRLLGQEPQVSGESVRAIEQCEADCGVTLPAAVREWYMLAGAEEMLAQREGACGPNSLTDILKAFSAAVSTPIRRQPASGQLLWAVAREHGLRSGSDP